MVYSMAYISPSPSTYQHPLTVACTLILSKSMIGFVESWFHEQLRHVAYRIAGSAALWLPFRASALTHIPQRPTHTRTWRGSWERMQTLVTTSITSPRDYQGTMSESSPLLLSVCDPCRRSHLEPQKAGIVFCGSLARCISGSTSPRSLRLFPISYKDRFVNSCNSLATVAQSLSFTTRASFVRALGQPSLETG